MSDSMIRIEADGIRAEFDPAFGMIVALEVEDGGRTVSLLHQAPWRHDPPDLPEGAAPHLAGLAGDFFCAPFGDASGDNAPAHGWPANSDWDHLDTERGDGTTIARFKLVRRSMGAELTKELRLVDGHPFLYQRHIFEGGMGTLAVANHAMVALPEGGRLHASPKRWWETPARALETDPSRGRSLLRYPARSEVLGRFPLGAEGEADLSRYPFGEAHEDFAVGIEAEHSPLGWTAVARPRQGDLFLSLRNPHLLPMTMLWFSNGGRHYAPWNGRHRGVLGVEEGINRALLGWSAAQASHPLDVAGVPTGLVLDPARSAETRHVTGAIAWTGEVANIESGEGVLLLRDDGGEVRRLPFDAGFLQLGA